ncbi:MAG: hypothetical protein SOY71_01110 [Dialister sp.]|nr:hypothetical protein [Dialister sp.]
MNKNNLGRLNDILFEQLDRMNNTDLKGQELQDEISRADAIIDIGRTIIQNGDLALKAALKKSEGFYVDRGKDAPKMLEAGDPDGNTRTPHR